jgi:biopolymer transport protein ExbD
METTPLLRRFGILACLGFAIATVSVAGEPARVVLAYPGQSTTTDRSEIVSVVLDHSAIFLDEKPVSPDELVSAVDLELKGKSLGVVCVYVRPDTKYGDVIRCVDQLRQSTAATVALFPAELPYGKNP